MYRPILSFNERVGLIVEHEQGSGRERAQAMASAERQLSELFRRAEVDYETRLASQVMMLCFDCAASSVGGLISGVMRVYLFSSRWSLWIGVVVAATMPGMHQHVNLDRIERFTLEGLKESCK